MKLRIVMISNRGWEGQIFTSWDFSGGPVAKIPKLPMAGGWGSIPGQGTTSYRPQLKRSLMLQLKILHVAMKTWSNQIHYTYTYVHMFTSWASLMAQW